MNTIFSKKWPFLFKFRLLWWGVLLILVIVLLYFKILPFGRATYSQSYPGNIKIGQGFIYNFSPVERVYLAPGEVPKLIGDPVYFSVFTPRTFDKVKLTLVYRDNLKIDTPIIEVGVLADKSVWRYDLRPVSNNGLDYLSLLWDKTVEDGKIFLQKEKNYDDLASFEQDLAKGQVNGCSSMLEKCVAVYNYEPEYSYRIANYQQSLPLAFDTVLRGPHQFYIYSVGSPIYLAITLAGLDQNSQPGPIEVIISESNKVVATKKINRPELAAAGEKQIIVFNEKDLPGGVYKVEIKIDDKTLIEKIYSSIEKFSFINKIWPAFNNQPLVFYTDIENLQVKVLNPANLQTINFDDQDFPLTEAYRQLDINSHSGGAIKKISLEKDDIILEGNGVFSLAPANLFNPTLKKVDRFFSVYTSPPYIIANYSKPRLHEGLKTAVVDINLKGVYREKGQYNFMIAIPGLKAEDDINDNIEIYDMKMEFSGRTLWQKIRY